MKIEYGLSNRRVRGAKTRITSPQPMEATRPSRVACLLALAHKFEYLVRSGEVRRLCRTRSSRPRVASPCDPDSETVDARALDPRTYPVFARARFS